MAELKKELKTQQQNNVTLMDRVRTLQAQVHIQDAVSANQDIKNQVAEVYELIELAQEWLQLQGTEGK